jgi:hypothetical protein
MNHWTNRPIGILLIILLAGTPELYAASGPASDSGTAPAATTNAAKTAPATTQQALQDAVSQESLPDSPGTLIAKQNEPVAPQSNTATQDPEAQQNDTQQPKTSSPSNIAPAQNGSANPGSSQSENGQQPVGAAAAQLGRTTGGAASKPAGAALAPTQQRRSRSLLLKLGLLAGAGIAVGSVAALSKASPSKPPGH